MSQLLSLSRAARLAGVSRRVLQKKIHDGDLTTFEGMIAVEDLLRLYPATELSHDTEFERLERIKATAYSRRVREHLMPSAEVLSARLNELGQELAYAKTQVAHSHDLLQQVLDRLAAGEDRQSLEEWLKSILAEPIQAEPTQQVLAQNTVLRVMEAHIKIRPTGHEFWLAGNQTLLEAGLRSGLSLNYGCANGNCGLCKARVAHGEVKKIRNHDYVLSEAEKAMNYVLLCSNTAVTDVELEALEAHGGDDIPHQIVTARVKRIDAPGADILLLHLQTPRTQRLRFLAGQRVTLSLASGERAEHPIASCPCDDRNLLFQIQQRPGDAFATQLASQIKKGDAVTLEGPCGDFLLNEDAKRAQIFLAFDTGFAPINSLVEHAMSLESAPSLSLYWWAKTRDGLYAHNLCRAWADALENFSYRPLIDMNPVPALLEDHPDLPDCELYLAGPEAMVQQARQQLLAAGLPETQLKIDAGAI